MLRGSALGLLIASALIVAGCGGEDAGPGAQTGASAPASEDASSSNEADLGHIHGLGVDPGSGALFVATHYGLFRAQEGQTQLQRVGESRQDVMGFSVIGPNRFIGSGHPDSSQNLPPNLGLIESRDGGQSFQNISLLGEADFHVLRSAGKQVYGFNGSAGQLMVSADGGREWTARNPPAGVIDLAIDPTDDQALVVSTERGLFGSSDAGKQWQPLRKDVIGLLAWPAAERLYLLDGQGQVAVSASAGKSFRSVGTIGGPPVAFVNHREQLYAALGDGNVVRSGNGGVDWQVRATP